MLFMSACSPTAPDMVYIAPSSRYSTAGFWIDKYEAKINGSSASSASGVDPQVNVNYAAAKAACEAASKRICTFREWKAACRGPKDRFVAFQDTYNSPLAVIDVCDVDRTTNNTPGSLPSKTGSHAQCKTEGIELYDMIGNLSEWTFDNDRSVPVSAGVAFYQAASNSSCDTKLSNTPGSLADVDPANESTDIGFRCCADQPPGAGSPPSFPF